ncbi:hypothetical protein PR202_gb27075 [Eleusine coracana subsp. coracana]|uniref:Uncharacterized protein n=1 Tax=Eleusine coracana subsp. coracana TaxID=191504 RepID=A0AAV5FTS6_ELECO|nr:hypothetical protein PR202_ga24129 [Eleusine coracana subsp. coracana]GJN38067.1 hypothetical protein PR202_gb27075 [Eleusine coracana subsp. coracana]
MNGSNIVSAKRDPSLCSTTSSWSLTTCGRSARSCETTTRRWRKLLLQVAGHKDLLEGDSGRRAAARLSKELRPAGVDVDGGQAGEAEPEPGAGLEDTFVIPHHDEGRLLPSAGMQNTGSE